MKPRDMSNIPFRQARRQPWQHTSFETYTPKVKWNADKGYLAFEKLSNSGNIEDIKKVYPQAYEMCKLSLERYEFQAYWHKISFPKPLDMVKESLLHGPDFTEKYADAWKYNRLEWLQGITLEDRPEPPYSSWCRWSDEGVDSVFHWGFLPYWEEVCEDIELMWEEPPVESPDRKEYLQKLEDIASDLSELYFDDDEIQKDPDIFDTYTTSGSNSYDGQGTKIPSWLMEYTKKYHDGFDINLRAIRAKAAKRPGETRDIVIMTPGSRRTHRKVTSHMAECIKRLPE